MISIPDKTSAPPVASPRQPLWRASLDGVPLVIPVVLTVVTVAAGYLGKIPVDMIGGLAVITGLGMILGPLGNRMPVLSRIGGGALVCLMLPSILVFLNVLPDNLLAAANSLMKQANFLYFVICTLVVGSIVGMRRSTMLQGIAKVFVPLVVGTLVAVGVGMGVAMLFGYSPGRAFFYIVVPILGGGIGEGVIPLSAAYSTALGGDAKDYVAQLIPAAVIANITAIICAGALSAYGRRHPQYDGQGELVRTSDERLETAPEELGYVSYSNGVLTIVGLYVLGSLLSPLVHLPAPVLVIILSVIAKVLNVFPPSVEHAVRGCYRIVSGYFIYPTMIGLGLLYVPLKSLASVISVGYVVTCVVVVLSMVLSGWFVGRLVRMFEIDASLVTACHSGLGGTGDVAILSAANRMNLMPYAQISTRIGGVSTVIVAASLVHLIA